MSAGRGQACLAPMQQQLKTIHFRKRMSTKTSAELTLFDRLSQLTFVKAVKLLGARGSRLIAEGGKYDIDITTRSNSIGIGFG